MAVGAGIGAFFGNMSPETKAALIQSGLGTAGSVLAGKAGEAQTKFQSGANLLGQANTNALGARQDALGIRQGDYNARAGQLSSDRTNKAGEIDAADRLVLSAMGKSPLEFAEQRARMAGRANMFAGPMVPGYLKGQVPGFMASGLSPKTIQMMTPSADKEKGYWDAVAMASKGRFQGPGLEGAYGDYDPGAAAIDRAVGGTTGKSGDYFNKVWGDYEGQRDKDFAGYTGNRDAKIDEYVNLSDKQKAEAKALMDGTDKLAAGEKKGGFWSKLGQVIKIAGPIAAMAIPGIGPAVAIAIAAGSASAGTKLTGGSWTDALIAGGISGATQGLLGPAGGKAGNVAAGLGKSSAAAQAATSAAQNSVGAGMQAALNSGIGANITQGVMAPLAGQSVAGTVGRNMYGNLF